MKPTYDLEKRIRKAMKSLPKLVAEEAAEYSRRSTSQEKVVIGAGNSKVKYAKAHNEGFSGSVVVKSFRRIGKNGKIHNVRSHTRKMDIPRRQFMGRCAELEEILRKETERLFRNVMR